MNLLQQEEGNVIRWKGTGAALVAGCVAVAALVAGADAQVGEWRVVGAPEGQETFGLLHVDGTVFARAELPSNIPGGDAWSVKMLGYESVNAGAEWSRSGVVLPAGGTAFTDPPVAIGNTIYVHAGRSTYRSDDKGRTWSELSGPSGYASFYRHMYWSGTVLSIGKYVCDLSEGTWSQVPVNSVDIHQLSRFAKLDGRMVAVSSRTGLFYSDDDGTSWSPSSFEPECVSIYTMNDRVYAVAGDSSGLYVSNDGGARFTRTNADIKRGFLRGARGELYCVDRIGNALYRISSDGATVTPATVGPWREIHDVDASENYLLAATDIGVFRSVDDGRTWYAANKGLGYQTITRMTAAGFEGDTLYCVTDDGVWRSTSHGERWKNIGMHGIPMYDVVSHGGKVYATGDDKIYVSGNHGATWDEIAVSTNDYVGGYPSLFVYEGDVYFNNTQTLSLISGLSLEAKASDPGRCWVADGYVYSTNAKRTTDFASWEDLTGLANPHHVRAGFVSTATHVFAGMLNSRFEPFNDQAYRSADGTAFVGLDGGLRQGVGASGDCWLSAICARGDTVYAFEEDGGSFRSEVKYVTSTGSRWNRFDNVTDNTGLGMYTTMVATRRSLHFGGHRYDSRRSPPHPRRSTPRYTLTRCP